MKQPGDPEPGNRKRRPIPWPRHVEIAAVFAVAFALLAFFYVFFGSASEDLRRFAVDLGYEDSYVKSCKTSLAYYLKTYQNQRLVQQAYSKNVDPHDVLLTYGAQDPSGATFRGEFRCLFRPGSAYSSDIGPLLNDVEVDGRRLPLGQTVRIDLFAPMEMQQNR